MSGPSTPAWDPSPASGGTGGSRTGRRFRSSAGLAGLLRMALRLDVLLGAVSAAVLLAASAFAERPGDWPIGDYADLLAAARLLAIATVILVVVTALLWFAWSSRVSANALALGVGEGSVGPRGMVGWWLVPLADLVVPMGAIAGLGRRLSDDERPARDGLVVVWWLAFLAGSAALLISALEIRRAADAEAYRSAFLHAGLAEMVWLLAGVLAIAVVRSLQSAEDRRVSRARTWVGPIPNVLGAAGARVAVARAGVGQAGVSGPGAGQRASGWGTAAAQPRGGRRRSPLSGLWALILLFLGGAFLVPRLLDTFGFGGPEATPRLTTRPTLVRPVTPAPGATPRRPASSQATQAPTPAATLAITPLPSPPTKATALAFLLDHASSGDGTCRAMRPSSIPASAVGGIVCDAAGDHAVASLTYAVYPSVDAARTAYDTIVIRTGVDPDSGDCFAGRPGETAFATDSEDAGRVVCASADRNGLQVSTIDWVDERLAILGRAEGSATLEALFGWWKDRSGPN